MQLVDRDGQAVTSLNNEGRYQLDQERRGRGPRNRALEGKVRKTTLTSPYRSLRNIVRPLNKRFSCSRLWA